MTNCRDYYLPHLFIDAVDKSVDGEEPLELSERTARQQERVSVLPADPGHVLIQLLLPLEPALEPFTREAPDSFQLENISLLQYQT